MENLVLYLLYIKKKNLKRVKPFSQVIKKEIECGPKVVQRIFSRSKEISLVEMLQSWQQGTHYFVRHQKFALYEALMNILLEQLNENRFSMRWKWEKNFTSIAIWSTFQLHSRKIIFLKKEIKNHSSTQPEKNSSKITLY